MSPNPLENLFIQIHGTLLFWFFYGSITPLWLFCHQLHHNNSEEVDWKTMRNKWLLSLWFWAISWWSWCTCMKIFYHGHGKSVKTGNSENKIHKTKQIVQQFKWWLNRKIEFDIFSKYLIYFHLLKIDKFIMNLSIHIKTDKISLRKFFINVFRNFTTY